MLNKLLLILLTINCSLLTAEAQWVQVSNGMGNVVVRALAYSGNNIYAGVQDAGVYLSTNNGTNWTQTSLNNRDVYSLAANGNYVFAGTGPQGLYRSTDNGTSWTLTSVVQRFIYSLAVNGNNVFEGESFGGVRLSTDNGASWTPTSLLGYVYSLAINGNYIFAGKRYGTGVWSSTNNGTNWTQTPLADYWIHSLAANGNYTFAGTDASGVYLSTNNGISWTQSSLNNQVVLSLAVNGNNIFAGTDGSGVYVSNDNGANWTQRNEGLAGLSAGAPCILNNYIFAGTNQSVYRRTFGELTGIKPISGQLPSHYALEQNYPNPFNPVTVIRYSLMVNSFVSLKVFDVLGNEITTLVNESLKPGTYEVDWNASNYPSGIYYYKLTTGEFSETRKAVLIK